MAKSFKEIGKKAEALIEQGREANQKVQRCQVRVASSKARVAAARKELVAASETDEDGNPVGDVERARAQLSMAENQLEASQRALSSARADVNIVKKQKNAQVQEIQKHNKIERANIDKLRKLKFAAFGEDSTILTEGMAQRLNEAEDTRVELLRSMGIDANPNYISIDNGGDNGFGWQGGGFSTLDTSGQLQKYKGGGGDSKKTTSNNGIATPVGGGLVVPINYKEPINDDINGISDMASEEFKQTNQDISILTEEFQNNNGDDYLKSGNLQEAYNNYVIKIIETSVLSIEQKIYELNCLRNQIMTVNHKTLYQAEINAIKSSEAILKLSPEEKRQMGERYINNILEIYRDNLLDQGVVSIAALDASISELRSYYLGELEKDLLGIQNGLYLEPNYDELIKKINNLRPQIANVSPCDNMTFEQADSGHVNPNYGIDDGYSINCQSCVVTFEARERGYNVEVLPCTKGSALERLSRDPRMAWIDPKTGRHPDYIYDNNRRTPEEYLDFMNKVIKSGNRYTIQFVWKGRGHSGHIVNVDRTSNGLLRIKDNQRGMDEKSEWIGDCAVLDYLSKAKYEDRSLFGGTTPCVPQLLRIDNMDFDFSIVNNIMKGVDNGKDISN